MSKKKCYRCIKIKQDHEFYSYKTQTNNICKDCNKEYNSKYRLSNKAKYSKNDKKQRKKRYNRNKQYVVDYLLSHPCVDCGEDNPILLEFDHLRDKQATITDLASNRSSIGRIQEEIDKCEVRCANCHRLKTAITCGWYKDVNLGKFSIRRKQKCLK